MSPQALPYVVLLGILFGSTLIVSRFSVGQFNPLTYIGLRLSLAGLCHVLIYTLSKARVWPRGRRLWKNAAVLGVFATAIPMTAIVSSLQFQSSGVTSVLLTTGPALTVLMAHFLLPDETLTRRKSLGVLLALAGAILLAVRGESGLPDIERANPLGYILVVGAMISASGSTIYARKFMRDLDTFDVASVRMWIAALVIMPLSLLLVGFDLSQVTSQGYAALVYAAMVGTFAGMMLAFYNIQRFGATASSVTAYVIPIVAMIGGVLILGETITSGMIVGMGLIIAGVALINQRPRRVAQQASAPPG
ncbi:MAG: DMT family transporter [Chloroflexota bacterium]|nr:MAG: DMT family transporter [Chloroflexota bacterium]